MNFKGNATSFIRWENDNLHNITLRLVLIIFFNLEGTLNSSKPGFSYEFYFNFD